jgi:hypothetical protein
VLTEDLVRNVMHRLSSDDANCDVAIRHLEAGRLTGEAAYVRNEVDETAARWHICFGFRLVAETSCDGMEQM